MPPGIPASDTRPAIPDYELLRPIGRGSYGEVWLARSFTGVFRVIKIVRRDSFADERPYLRELEGISRFQAAASGRPRQLALLHVGRNDADGYFYYVMEPADDAETGSEIIPDKYVPLTLKELFSRRGRIPATECIQLVLELARGLVVLHGAGLIHRDIKPSNIIFVQRVPKLADVGLVASSEATMTCAGTPGYSPPEGAGTVGADIYSLGKVLYEIATGLDRMDFPKVPRDILDGADPQLIREINAIVLRACHPQDRERHPSAEALARDLELVQAGRSVAFYEALRKRLRAFAIAAATVAVLAGGGATLFVWRSKVLQAANDRTRHALYRSDLAVAQLALSSGDLGRALAALKRQEPGLGESDLRDLESGILTEAARGEGYALEPLVNGAAVQQLAVDPTGRWIAASFTDDKAAIWDFATGKIVRRLDNVRVLGGFLKNGLLIIDETNRALRGESPLSGTAWRKETGERLGSLLGDGSFAVVPPTGDFLVKILKNQDSASNPINTITPDHAGFTPSDWSLSPDAQSFVIALYKEEGAHRARILSGINLETKREMWNISISSKLVWVKSSPNNTHFAVNIGGVTPVLFPFNDPTNQIALRGHAARVLDAAYSTDGTKVATASADQTIRTWDANTGIQLHIHRGLGAPATAVTWTPEGDHLIAGDDSGRLRVFPFPSQRPPSVRPGYFSDAHGDITFQHGGALIAVTETTNTVAVLNVASLDVLYRITNVFQLVRFSTSNIIALGSDFSIHEVTPDRNSSIRSAAVLGTGFSVKSFSISPDTRHLTLTGEGGVIYLVDLDSFETKKLQDPDGSIVWTSAFSLNSGELWTGNASGSIRTWNSKTGQPIGKEVKTDGDLTSLALSPDGHWLGAAVYGDSSVRILDRSSGKWLPRRLKHRRFVQTLTFTKSGSRLISGGADGRVVFWSVPTFEEVSAFEIESTGGIAGDEGVATLRLSESEDSMAALTEDGRLAVWRTKAAAK